MKKLYFIIYFWGITLNTFSQQYNLLPLEVSKDIDEIASIEQNKNILFYENYKMGYNSIGDTSALIASDTCFAECTFFDMNTLLKTKYKLKSSLDSIVFNFTKLPYFNSFDNNYYFIEGKVSNKKINSKYSNIIRTQNLHVTRYNNLAQKVKTVKLENQQNYGSYGFCDKLYFKDSIVYALYVDTFNNWTFTSLSLLDGHVIAKVPMINKFPNGGFLNMSWLNDSVIVAYSDYIHYVNVKTMTLLDTVNTTWADPLNDAILASTLLFNKEDSSFIFNGQASVATNTYIYVKTKANGQNVRMFTYPVFDSISFTTQESIYQHYNCWDFKTLDNLYTALMVYPFSENIIIGHTLKNGITDWIKVFPANVGKKVATVVLHALDNDGVFAVVNCFENDSSQSKYDAYYIALDKYGNQTSYPLGNTDIKPTTIAPIIYPNPCTKKIIIGNINLQDIKSLSILNTAGQLVKRISPTLILDVSNLNGGNYYLQIKTDKKNICTPFIKEN
jgi:Secretion system C-terminal sorting domain